MEYDIILVVGEEYFDHPLCGTAIIKRLLEKNGYTVGLIEFPESAEDVKRLGKPKLFFGVSSGGIDSMVKNYTPLKKVRADDKYLKRLTLFAKDRAVTVYSNWIKSCFKDSRIVLGGTEASLRRFVHYDYWQNRLRKSILLDTRADIMVYGSGEKPVLEIAKRIKEGKELKGILGTCIISRELPDNFEELPTTEEVMDSKEKFCDMQLQFANHKNLAQKNDTRYCLQFKSPKYVPKDLDEYYELPFTRTAPKELRGFEFSVVTHRGCIGGCNFCSLTLLQGDKIVSRSEESIIREVKRITKLSHFKGKIDDVGGPSANMYGMDCHKCHKDCLACNTLNRSNKRMINLLKRIRQVPGVKKAYIKSGIRFDLANEEYIKEVVEHHIFDTLRIAPEHINKDILKLMNKDYGDIEDFKRKFLKYGDKKQLSYYFMTAHPGSSQKEADELKKYMKKVYTESVQIFTPTPMSMSTCMYYTGMNPKTKRKIYVPYTYREKKDQKNDNSYRRTDEIDSW